MVAQWIPLIMQGASDTMGILSKLFGGGGSSYNSDSAKAAKWQHNYNLAAMKQAQKYTLDQMAQTYNYNARGVKQQYNYNLALQKQAQQYDTNMYQQRYQMQVQDLKKAGINPLYGLGTAPAITAGANSVGAPTTGGGMSPIGSGLADLAGENNSKRLFKLERAKTISSIIGQIHVNSANRAQAKKLEAEADMENQKTLNMQTERIGQQIDNLRNYLETEQLPKKLELEIKGMIQGLEEQRSKINEANTQSALNKAAKDGTMAETALKKSQKEKIITENQAAKDVEDYFKKHPGMKRIRTWMNAYNSMQGNKIKNKVQSLNPANNVIKGGSAVTKVMGKVIK